MERAAAAVAAIFQVLSVPVMLLNFGGGIVGGIWLIVIGNWGLLGLGILLMFVSSIALGLVLAPGLIFAGPAALLMDRGRNVFGMLFALLGNIYTFVVMTFWCVGCFYVVFRNYYQGGSIWPYLLWTYGMATGPWTYMAAREGQDSIGSSLSAFGACIGAIAMMGTMLFETHPTIVDIAIAFCLPLSLVVLLQFGLAVTVMRQEARGY